MISRNFLSSADIYRHHLWSWQIYCYFFQKVLWTVHPSFIFSVFSEGRKITGLLSLDRYVLVTWIVLDEWYGPRQPLRLSPILKGVLLRTVFAWDQLPASFRDEPQTYLYRQRGFFLLIDPALVCCMQHDVGAGDFSLFYGVGISDRSLGMLLCSMTGGKLNVSPPSQSRIQIFLSCLTGSRTFLAQENSVFELMISDIQRIEDSWCTKRLVTLVI